MAKAQVHQSVQEQLTETVRCLAIPLNGYALLVPGTAVAEVADPGETDPLPYSPPWLLGVMRWRGLNIPLVAFEKLIDDSDEVAVEPTRVVVLNTLNGDEKLPFVALAASGIPRLAIVREDSIDPCEKRSEDGDILLRRVKMDNSEFIIPDFDLLEQILLRLGI